VGGRVLLMIHILTIHFKDKWVDIQKKQLEKFIDEDYKVYTRLGENYKKHKDKFDGAVNGKGHWTESMGVLLDFIHKNAKVDDKVLLLDSDAFPIAPVTQFLNEKLEEYPFVSCQEPEHEIDNTRKIPHPMFMLFKAKHILEGDLEGYLNKIIDDGTGTWWDGVIRWLKINNYEYYPIERSNVTNLHPLYFGIYGDVIYHHWAGSRKMVTRPDRRRASSTGEDIEVIAEENHEMSNTVFEQIENQLDVFMDYLMGKYEGTLE
jgi:hypothetical protein